MNPIYFETLFAFGGRVASAAPHPDPLPGGERGLLVAKAAPQPDPLPEEPLVASAAHHPDTFPARFAIVTAYATTGQRWTRDENDVANARLHQELEALGVWMREITGYSPTTPHAEPGWAVALELDAACDVGLRYRQDAIYYVIGDALSVSYCDERRGLVAVGSFRERVTRVPDDSLQ